MNFADQFLWIKCLAKCILKDGIDSSAQITYDFCSDFVANLAIFSNFMCMEKLNPANFTYKR